MSGLWQDNAACRDADPRRFFANPDAPNARHDLQATAQEYCGTCPVADDCGEDADQHRDIGLRGGSYRSWPSKGYQRTPLVPGASSGRLTGPQRDPDQRARVDVDEVAFLQSCGLSRHDIAARLGVDKASLDTAEHRAARRARTEAAIQAAQDAAEAQPVAWSSAPSMQAALNETFGDHHELAS